MNWAIETTIGDVVELAGVEPNVEHAEGEEGEPDAMLVEGTRDLAARLAELLGGEEFSVTVHGHEMLQGNGFRTGHVSIVVSRLDPARGGT